MKYSSYRLSSQKLDKISFWPPQTQRDRICMAYKPYCCSAESWTLFFFFFLEKSKVAHTHVDPPRALRAPGRAALGARAHTRTSHTHTKTGWDAADTVASALSRPLPPPKPSNILSPRVFVQEGVAERAVPRGRRQHRRGDSGGLANHEYRVVRGARWFSVS